MVEWIASGVFILALSLLMLALDWGRND